MAESIVAARTALPEVVETPRLEGDLAVWLVILAEMLAFAVLFLSYAFARTLDVELFDTSQATLDVRLGGINTALLVSGSWCVVRAIQAIKLDAREHCIGWLFAALLCGSGFVGIKLFEYSAKWDAGLDLSSNTFFMFYFLLTGFHFFHVIAGMIFLGILMFKTWQGHFGSHDFHALETGGAFWHMVDLLWIVLFPLIYVMR